MVQENKVRVSESVCLSKYFGTCSTNGWFDRYQGGPFDAPERWKDDGRNLRRMGSTCQVLRVTAQYLAKINLSMLQTMSMDGSGLNFADRYQPLVDTCHCGYQSWAPEAVRASGVNPYERKILRVCEFSSY